MALAVNGSGTIFKKCDRSNHRPDSNKGCASSACQHTCDTPERCQHAWTLRYWANGRQVEKSFKDKHHPTTCRQRLGNYVIVSILLPQPVSPPGRKPRRMGPLAHTQRKCGDSRFR
jgi:hypothetical protein